MDRLTEFQDLLPLVLPSPANLTHARELHILNGVSLWDALILAACLDAGVDILYSEDVPAVTTFQTVRVINPFK
jgi:predicted nucleic acid-binding protein